MPLTRVSIEEKKALQFFFFSSTRKKMLVTMRWETLIKFEKLSVKMSNFWCAYLLSKNDSKGSFVCLYSFERKKFCKLLNRLFWYMTTKNRICKVKDRKNGILFWCRNLQRHFEKNALSCKYVHKYFGPGSPEWAAKQVEFEQDFDSIWKQ